MRQRVYIARHATPDWSRSDLPYHLPPGPPLIEQGEAEARALADFLQAAGVARIYSSPLERCAHTARIVSELSGADLFVLPQLQEWQPGENGDQVVERILPYFQRAAEESGAGAPVALIIHGGPIAFLLMELGLPKEEVDRMRTFDRQNPVPPAGAWLAQRSNSEEDWQLCLAFTPGHPPPAPGLPGAC
jgi:broad specificity phosphatase PhoE